MSSDISRQRFHPTNNFSGVLMQQGRVQLDADWNEWNDILDRRLRAETIDIIGRGVVPLETPEGFEIKLSGGSLTIGRGRIYVDGLQAENHGAGDLEFDAILAESRGKEPLKYEAQPYFPEPPALPKTGGPHLVYLDVWEREVTATEDPSLREVALGGPDTTSRVQTAWQVRVLPDVGAGATCATEDKDLKGWLDLIAPSAGRLTTRAIGGPAETDPCLIPPSGGYRGLENRTFRVEIHDGGAIGKATFKWSRDNASLTTGVSGIENNSTLTVERTLWDSERRFKIGDWVEITDDVREFSGAPGEIRRIANEVEDGSRRITLNAPLPAGDFPVDGQNQTTPARHTRIKRWDQAKIVRRSNDTIYVDLDAPGSTGLIEVPPTGTSLILENGVEVTFSVDGNGQFRAGDCWIFAARTADASVEELDEAPPRGVHHHYCRLALFTLPNDVLDCRHFWPPPFAEGEDCDCTLCVSADLHNQGTFTIQQAVTQIAKTGGTICLGPGIYNLRQAVQLLGAFAVRIRGQGAATVLIQPPNDAVFVINGTQWCTLDYFTIHTASASSKAPAIRLLNSVGTTIERLIIGPPTTEGPGPLIAIAVESGFLTLTKIRDNFIWAQNGIAFVAAAEAAPAGAPTVAPGATPPSGPTTVTPANPGSAPSTITATPGSVSSTVTAAPASGPTRLTATRATVALASNETARTVSLNPALSSRIVAANDIRLVPTVPPVVVAPPATGSGGTTPPPPPPPAAAAVDPTPLLLSGFYCEANQFRCSATGVQFGGMSLYLNGCSIARNAITATAVAGIAMTGFAFPNLDITANVITPTEGDGIVIGTGGVRICGNQVSNFANQTQHGIRLVPGLVANAILPVVVRENLLEGLRGNGVSIEVLMTSLKIEQNVLNGILASGISMTDGSSAGSLSVLGNELFNIAADESENAAFEYAAIYLQNVAAGAVSDNAIGGVGQKMARAEVIAGIRLDGCVDVRVSDNTIANLAPPTKFANLAAGVLVVAPLLEIEIAGNTIRRQMVPPAEPDDSNWQAVRILGASAEGALPVRFSTFGNLSAAQKINTIDRLAATGPATSERVGISANALHGYGASALVEAVLTGSCRFNENEASVAGSKVPAAVELSATTLIVASNRVTFDRERTSLDLQSPNQRMTALGNITTGPIHLNGASLAGTAWEKLNLIAT